MIGTRPRSYKKLFTDSDSKQHKKQGSAFTEPKNQIIGPKLRQVQVSREFGEGDFWSKYVPNILDFRKIGSN